MQCSVFIFAKFKAMSAVSITNVTVLDNPASFLTPFQFEISYECLTPLKDGIFFLNWTFSFIFNYLFYFLFLKIQTCSNLGFTLLWFCAIMWNLWLQIFCISIEKIVHWVLIFVIWLLRNLKFIGLPLSTLKWMVLHHQNSMHAMYIILLVPYVVSILDLWFWKMR